MEAYDLSHLRGDGDDHSVVQSEVIKARRQVAVLAADRLADHSYVTAIALRDKDPRARVAAVLLLSDEPKVLTQIAKEDADPSVRANAALLAVENAGLDQSQLKYLALNASFPTWPPFLNFPLAPKIRLAAVARLWDQPTLETIASRPRPRPSSPYPRDEIEDQIRIEAAGGILDLGELERLVELWSPSSRGAPILEARQLADVRLDLGVPIAEILAVRRKLSELRLDENQVGKVRIRRTDHGPDHNPNCHQGSSSVTFTNGFSGRWESVTITLANDQKTLASRSWCAEGLPNSRDEIDRDAFVVFWAARFDPQQIVDDLLTAIGK
jgi:hypothetical protein